MLASLIPTLLALATPIQIGAQQTDSSLLTIARIYSTRDFAAETCGPSRWVDNGAGYTTLEPAAGGKGRDLIRYDTDRGTRQVMLQAHRMVPAGGAEPLVVEQYAWSADQSQVLIFTNSRPV
ncbi:MAG TPA: hypothetical protein VFM14_18550 [Gemmatimonadales bacterium]|nr:hypothetical protein [Gemmatimonadales bacterium]